MVDPSDRKRKPRGEVLPHLERWRRRAGLTQAELAAQAGMARGTVSRAEAGEVMQYPTIRKLAKALGISVDDLRQAPAERT